MLKFRLLISPLNFVDTLCPNPSCKAKHSFGEFPTHAFDCKATNYFRIAKHNAICKILANFIKKTNPTAQVVKEKTFHHVNQDNGKQVTVRADLAVTLENGAVVLIDVTIVNQSNPSNAKGAARRENTAAVRAETMKENKYRRVN